MSLLGVPNFGVEVAKYLEREQHRRTAVSEWQKIETAPKDGCDILLSGKKYDRDDTGRWVVLEFVDLNISKDNDAAKTAIRSALEAKP